MNRIAVESCFQKDDRILNVTAAEALFGGARLLLTFLERAAAMTSGGRLVLVSPFLDAGILGCGAVFRPECATHIDLSLVTTQDAARSPDARAIAVLPWRSCEIRALNRLHAKIFAAVPERGDAIILLGSHNLTVDATRNVEAGVLVSGHTADAQCLITQLLDHVAVLRAQARPIHDSLSWPSPMGERVA